MIGGPRMGYPVEIARIGTGRFEKDQGCQGNPVLHAVLPIVCFSPNDLSEGNMRLIFGLPAMNSEPLLGVRQGQVSFQRGLIWRELPDQRRTANGIEERSA
jgi:hypothetical protein